LIFDITITHNGDEPLKGEIKYYKKKLTREQTSYIMLASHITLQFISCYKSSYHANSLLIVLQFLALIDISCHTINYLSWNFSYHAKNSHIMLQLLKLHNSSYHATVFIWCYFSYYSYNAALFIVLQHCITCYKFYSAAYRDTTTRTVSY